MTATPNKHAKIWKPEAIEILIRNWGHKSPPEIRDLIDEYNIAHPFKSGIAFAASTGGVIWKAREFGLVTEHEAEELAKAYKRKPIPGALKRQVVARDGGKCLICRTTDSLEVDHIKPVRFGGGDDASNLQTLCKNCHKIKGLDEIDCNDLKKNFVLVYHPAKDGLEVTFELEGQYKDMTVAYELINRGFASIIQESGGEVI